MKLLALETAVDSLSVCLWDEFKLKAVKTHSGVETASSRLMPLVSELFKKASWQPGDIDAIAVDVGPGRFTGLRLGVSAARTLGQLLQKPVVEVTSLEAVAAQGSGWDLSKPFVWKFSAELLCSLMEAGRNEVYMAAWRFHRPHDKFKQKSLSGRSLHTFGHHFKLVHSPCLFPFDRFLSFFKGCFQVQTIHFTGTGARAYQGELRKAFGSRARFAPAGHVMEAGYVAALGAEKFFRRESKPFNQVKPLYLRPSYAEEKKA